MSGHGLGALSTDAHEPFEHELDLAPQVVLRAVVLDHVVGSAALAVLVHLRGHARPYFGFRHVVAELHATNADVFVGGDEDDGLHLGLEVLLEQQRHLVDGDLVICFFQGIEHLLEAFADAGMEDGLELFAAGGVLEHDRRELSAVELAGFVQDLRAERTHHVAQALASVGDDDARQLVGGDHRNAIAFEQVGDRGFAAADPAGQAVDVHARRLTGRREDCGAFLGRDGTARSCIVRPFMTVAQESGWRVIEAAFERSATRHEDCPSDELAEVAIVGRSNVGKSSLLNALCRQQGLARVSRTPGRTQLINLFRLVLQSPERERRILRCADLPGYGFAATDRETRERFAPMIGGYLAERAPLRTLCLLVDLRRGLGDLDRMMLDTAAAGGVQVLVVATKSDKLGAAERGLARQRLATDLGIAKAAVRLTSASSRLGIDERGGLVDDLADFAVAPPRNVGRTSDEHEGVS